jgi:O-antigen ligase
MQAGSPSRPLLAVLALGAGLAAAAGLPILSDLGHGGARLGLVAVAAVVAGVMGTQGAGALTAIGDSRLTVSSPDRGHALHSSLKVIARHPIVGVGPGQAVLSWTRPDGRSLVAKYAHNEYVQVLVELGIVGLGLLLVMLGSIAAGLRRAAGRPVDVWAGGAAGLAGLCVGSAFDFLWHVPVIPLFGALLIGVALPPTRKEHQ